MANTEPPSYDSTIPTLYDETHRGTWHMSPHIASMGHVVSLIAHLQHYEAGTDGSFAVCIAGGSGNFISKQLYESIPDYHRPELKTSDLPSISFLMGGKQTALGTVFVPIMLRDADNTTRFRIILHAYVMPSLLMGMFISQPRWIKSRASNRTGDDFFCDFGSGETVRVKGEP